MTRGLLLAPSSRRSCSRSRERGQLPQLPRLPRLSSARTRASRHHAELCDVPDVTAWRVLPEGQPTRRDVPRLLESDNGVSRPGYTHPFASPSGTAAGGPTPIRRTPHVEEGTVVGDAARGVREYCSAGVSPLFQRLRRYAVPRALLVPGTRIQQHVCLLYQVYENNPEVTPHLDPQMTRGSPTEASMEGPLFTTRTLKRVHTRYIWYIFACLLPISSKLG